MTSSLAYFGFLSRRPLPEQGSSRHHSHLADRLHVAFQAACVTRSCRDCRHLAGHPLCPPHHQCHDSNDVAMLSLATEHEIPMAVEVMQLTVPPAASTPRPPGRTFPDRAPRPRPSAQNSKWQTTPLAGRRWRTPGESVVSVDTRLLPGDRVSIGVGTCPRSACNITLHAESHHLLA